MSDHQLWTVAEMADAMGAQRIGALPIAISGISIDSRTVKASEAFFAIRGDVHDGHDFVAAAASAGAALAVVSAQKRSLVPSGIPLLVVRDVLEGLIMLARAARNRSKAKVAAVTGSVGKTSTKEALRIALATDGEVHASLASFNNHWGVPLSLARLPASARYAVFEIGMNHAGEITPLTQLVKPHVAIITTVEPVHLEFFASVEAIADAKAEIFSGVEPGGSAVINRDNPHFERLKRHAEKAGIKRVASFGENANADARLLKYSLHPDSSTVNAEIFGTRVTYELGAPGRHLVLNSLAVLATAGLLNMDVALAASALAELKPALGRGTRTLLNFGEGSAVLIDESYNANPASMRAALALLGQAPVGPRGRRMAVLGDMLELGSVGAEFHRSLADDIAENAIDLVFCAGPLMGSLWQALPASRRGGYAESAKGIEAEVVAAVRAGDAIMVKGSLGSKMGPIVKALIEAHGATRSPAEVAQRQG